MGDPTQAAGDGSSANALAIEQPVEADIASARDDACAQLAQAADDGSLEQLTAEDLRRSWRDLCLMPSPLLSVVVVVVVLVRLQ